MDLRILSNLEAQLSELTTQNAQLRQHKDDIRNHKDIIHELRSQHFVRVRLPECDRAAVQALRNFSSAFFDLSMDDKTSLRGFRRVKGHLVGYQNQGDREFAELRMGADGQPSPWLTEPENTDSRTEFQSCCAKVVSHLQC
jgi:isopenicillin N synthase-like dioxygenase